MGIPIPDDRGVCLITGASSGIGKEFARQMAERGYNLVLAARRQELLDALAAEITEACGVRVAAVGCDVTDEAQRDALLEGIAERGDHVDVLINNAGRGEGGSFAENSYHGELSQIDLNVRALVALTHRVLTGMIERGTGAVLNVASTAAFQPMPRQAVYAATKAFVLAFGDGLSQELKGTGVSITTLCPGPTRTEFFGSDMAKYEGSTPGAFWQEADEVAKAGIDGMFRRKRVVVSGAVNRIGALAGQYSPTGMVLTTLDRFWPVGKH